MGRLGAALTSHEETDEADVTGKSQKATDSRAGGQSQGLAPVPQLP